MASGVNVVVAIVFGPLVKHATLPMYSCNLIQMSQSENVGTIYSRNLPLALTRHS